MKNFMQKFVKWVDPKLEKYREPAPVVPEPVLPPYVPESLEDFVGVLRRTPKSILGYKERALIASAMTFNETHVGEIMLPKNDMTFVFEHDFLGPLMLDKLYKSGFSHFPVLSSDGRQIVGLIETDSLNSLEVKHTDRASKYIDSKIYYLRTDYSLAQAMSAFLRTNCYFFVVIDQKGSLAGMLTYKMLISYILGYEPNDDFDDDSSIAAVIKRDLTKRKKSAEEILTES